jgi:hypothetical protein
MVTSNVFSRVYDWFTFADYDRAKESANSVIVKRFSRGNVLIQSGRYLDDKKLNILSQRGDVANNRIQASVAHAKRHAAKR